jgi:hypothetical protein
VFVKFCPFGYIRASSLKMGWQKTKRGLLFWDYLIIGRIHVAKVKRGLLFLDSPIIARILVFFFTFFSETFRVAKHL